MNNMNEDDNITSQYLIKKLSTSNPVDVIKAAQRLGETKDESSIYSLIEVLLHTSNSSIRNAVAIALRDIGQPQAILPLISLLSDPKTDGNRGTLVYALEVFDLSDFLPNLVDIVINDNFEASHQALSVIESANIVVDNETLNVCLKKANEALALIENEERTAIICELIETLDNFE